MRPNPTDHLGLVHYWSKKFARNSDDRDDVAQMGMLGLLKACELFDAARGVQFSTFASLLIRQAIVRELKRTQPLIRVPEHWTMDRRIPVRSLNRRALAGGDGNEATELGDLLPDDRVPTLGECADRDEHRALVCAALRRLPQRDRQVLELRYGIRADGSAGEPLTLAEVGALLRVSRERVRQLQLRAEARLARRLAG